MIDPSQPDSENVESNETPAEETKPSKSVKPAAPQESVQPPSMEENPPSPGQLTKAVSGPDISPTKPVLSARQIKDLEIAKSVDYKGKAGVGKDDGESLICPGCGSVHFVVKGGLVAWCQHCGMTATHWAYANPKRAEKAKAYVRTHGGAVGGLAAHADTPVCGAPIGAVNSGKRCTNHSWQHDGKKLLWCRSCGANFETKGRKQPANVAEIIATMGPATPDRYQNARNPRAVTPEEESRARTVRKQAPGTDNSKHVVRSS